jgi:hypothetical protein
MFSIDIPLVDSKNNPQGKLVQFKKRTPTHIPRIGESVFVGLGRQLKVVEVSYTGKDLHLISLTLEPMSSTLREHFTNQPKSKYYDGWTWSDGLGYGNPKDFDNDGVFL